MMRQLLLLSSSVFPPSLTVHDRNFDTATRNKYVVVGLGGATLRMGHRLDSPYLKTLPQGTVRGRMFIAILYSPIDGDVPAIWCTINTYLEAVAGYLRDRVAPALFTMYQYGVFHLFFTNDRTSTIFLYVCRHESLTIQTLKAEGNCNKPKIPISDLACSLFTCFCASTNVITGLRTNFSGHTEFSNPKFQGSSG